MWICPACTAPLDLSDRTWRCEAGHCYDQAKEGYVNLLLAQNKRSKEPGDNKDMINARRAFLDGGYYQPLAKRVSELFANFLPAYSDVSLNLFDAGCGEGYYLDKMATFLQSDHVAKTVDAKFQFAGCDISKIGVQKAAKKYSGYHFSVASTFQLPLADSSIHGLLQIFAPCSGAEVARVLTGGGVWVQVNPAADHLKEIKETLYESPQLHDEHQSVPEGFEVVVDEVVNFTLDLPDNVTRTQLLMMTPYYWSASAEKLTALQENLTQVSAAFHIRVFKKQELALFLDRDGVINVDHGYVYKPEEFEFMPHIFQLCQRFQQAGFRIIVVTNQSGIGRGYYTEDDFNHLSEWMTQQFKLHNVTIHSVYFCPHHKDGALGDYQRDCPCRKPNPGMLLNAAKQHHINFSASVMVGDKLSDMTAAQRAGVGRRILFVPKASESDLDSDAVGDISFERVTSLEAIKPHGE